MKSIIVQFVLSLFKFVLCTISWIFHSCTTVPIFLISFTCRFFASKFVPLVYEEVDKLLTTTSAAFASERPEHRHTGTISFVFEGVIELEDVRSKFESRVVQKKTGNGSNLQWPELQQCIVHHLGFPFWKWDKTFNIKNHIRMLEVDPKFEESGLNPQEILDIIEEDLIHKPFPAQQSPWEILIVPNFRDTPKYGSGLEEAGVGTMLVYHGDHALGDGTSVAKVFEEFLAGNTEIPSRGSLRSPTWASSTWKFLSFYFLLPYNLTCILLYFKSSWKPAKLTFKYNVAVSPTIPLEMIKSIRKAHNVSFSAVLLVSIGNALEKFMKEGGYQLPKTLLCCPARIVEGHPLTKLRNHITMTLVALPMGRNPNQLALLQASLNEANNSEIPGVIFFLIRLSGGLWTKLMQRTRNLDSGGEGIILSNMSFYEDEQRFGDTNKLRSVLVRGISPNSGNGIVIIATSCKEGIRCLFQIDEGIVPKTKLHAQVFIKYFLDELETMQKTIQQNSIL